MGPFCQRCRVAPGHTQLGMARTSVEKKYFTLVLGTAEAVVSPLNVAERHPVVGGVVLHVDKQRIGPYGESLTVHTGRRHVQQLVGRRRPESLPSERCCCLRRTDPTEAVAIDSNHLVDFVIAVSVRASHAEAALAARRPRGAKQGSEAPSPGPLRRKSTASSGLLRAVVIRQLRGRWTRSELQRMPGSAASGIDWVARRGPRAAGCRPGRRSAGTRSSSSPLRSAPRSVPSAARPASVVNQTGCALDSGSCTGASSAPKVRARPAVLNVGWRT